MKAEASKGAVLPVRILNVADMAHAVGFLAGSDKQVDFGTTIGVNAGRSSTLAARRHQRGARKGRRKKIAVSSSRLDLSLRHRQSLGTIIIAYALPRAS